MIGVDGLPVEVSNFGALFLAHFSQSSCFGIELIVTSVAQRSVPAALLSTVEEITT